MIATKCARLRTAPAARAWAMSSALIGVLPGSKASARTARGAAPRRSRAVWPDRRSRRSQRTSIRDVLHEQREYLLGSSFGRFADAAHDDRTIQVFQPGV